MLLHDWSMTRRDELVIPIDYDAAPSDILTTVTWLALMQGGLAVLAKFKVFNSNDGGADVAQLLPSWVIDWRISARVIRLRELDMLDPFIRELITIDNPWAVRYGKKRDLLDPGGLFEIFVQQLPAPPGYETFRRDNQGGALSFRMLVVRGIILSQYYVHDHAVWEMTKPKKRRKCWNVPNNLGLDDIVVYLVGFARFDLGPKYHEVRSGEKYVQGPSNQGGFWVLRPSDRNEYTLVAYLSWCKRQEFSIYDHCDYCPPAKDSSPDEHGPTLRPLATYPEGDDIDYRPPTDAKGDIAGIRKFVIV
jgi:hypothetical protein